MGLPGCDAGDKLVKNMADDKNKIILILGGARSGKSAYAQQLAAVMGHRVLFCATAEALDEEMQDRIKKHRESRPGDWQTLEASRQVGRALNGLTAAYDAVIVDCITLLISNCMHLESDDAAAEKDVTQEIDSLIDAVGHRRSNYILVSNEVGGGLVPDNKLGRIYRDHLGKTNQRLARAADEVYLMVAGIAVRVK